MLNMFINNRDESIVAYHCTIHLLSFSDYTLASE